MTKEEKQELRKERKRRAKLSRPLTPEQRADKHQKKRMKERAAILSIKLLGGNLFKVWGGEQPHIVRATANGVICDCLGWETARNHNCSHVMKFRLTYGDLKK
jgi:hypothetical protein